MSNNNKELILINKEQLIKLGFIQKGTTCTWIHPLLPFHLDNHPTFYCYITGTKINVKYTSDIQFLLDLHNPPTKALSQFEAIMQSLMRNNDNTREIIENWDSSYTLIEMSVTNCGAYFKLSFHDDAPEIDEEEWNGYDFVADTNDLINYIIKPK